MLSTNPTQPDCRFCSTVSKANGHDPIGSAWPYDHWLIIETPQPWTAQLVLHPIYEQLIKPLWEQGVQVRPLAIAPDRDYSIPGHTRILYYRRPAGLFAQLQKQEFLVPPDHIYPLAAALLQQPDQLPQFEPYRQPTDQVRDLMICTHGNVDVACARFGFPIYEQLRKNHAASSNGRLRVWRCSHFGGHVFAPTLVDLPAGHYWGHLEAEMLDLLVHRNGSVADLRPFYRGWAGLSQFEQIAEREIWIQEGWQWLSYLKRGETIATAPTANDDDKADWAEVRIEYMSPDGSVNGAYTAKVETCGTVLTQWRSGQEHSLELVKQYQVTQLRGVQPLNS